MSMKSKIVPQKPNKARVAGQARKFSLPKPGVQGGITSVSAPVSKSFRVVSGNANVRQNASGTSTRVKHRELVIGSIVGSTTFTVQNNLQLNPGIAATFPWLSTIAVNWEQYRVHSLQVEYIPIAPTSTAGDIILVPEYDANDLQPTTETQAANNKGAIIDSCWANVMMPFDPDSMMALGPRRFVRSAAVAGDLKTFDVGRLFVCSNNEVNGTSAIGKIYLNYDIEFFVPQSSPLMSTSPTKASQIVLASDQTFTTTVAAVLLFATSIADPLNINSTVSSGVFTPPAGNYLVLCKCGFIDSSAETLTGVLSLFKNSAALTPNITGGTSFAVVASGQTEANVQGIVSCNGTDTISLSATLTGIAGTLKAQATRCTLTFLVI